MNENEGILTKLEITKLGRYEIGVLILIMMGWMFDGAEIYIFGSTAPYISKSLNYAATLTAYILVAFNVGQLISAYLLSFVADKIGRRQAFIYSILIYSIASVLTGLSWNTTSLTFFRLLTGIGTGVEWGLGATIAAEIVPASRRGTAVSIFNGGFPVGGFLAALVFKFVVAPNPIIDWRYAYFILVIPAFLTLLFRTKYFKEPERFRVSKEAVKRNNLKSSYRELFVNKKMRFNTILATLIAAPMRWNTLPWLALVGLGLVLMKHFTPSMLAAYLLFNSVAAMIAYYTAGSISDKFGRKKTWFLFFGFVVLGYLLTFIPSPGDVSLIMLGGLLWGFGWGFSPIEVVIVAELFPTRARASGEGFAVGIMGLSGAIVMALLWVRVVSLYGLYAGAAFLMWPLVIPPIAIALMYRETSGKVLETLDTIRSEEEVILNS